MEIEIDKKLIWDAKDELTKMKSYSTRMHYGFTKGVEFALEQVNKKYSIPFVSSCYAVFDEEDNIVQLYQTEEKANKGLDEFRNSHPHTTFYVDTLQIN